MRIEYIKSLLVLYEELNFSQASAKLYISQQGLSRQIQATEKELRVKLFDRNKISVLPTEICKELYPLFCSTYDNYQQISEAIACNQLKSKKVLSIAFASGLSHGVGTDYIFEYQKLHSELNLEVQEWSKDVCIQMLLRNQLDIAFLVNPFDKKLFQTYPLVEDSMYLAVHRSNPFASEKGNIDFCRLEGENVITGSSDNALRRLFDYYCALTQIEPHIIVSSSYSLDFVNAMTQNLGVATVTSAMAAKITNSEIVLRKLNLPEPGIMYGCMPLSSTNTDAKSLLKSVQKYFIRNPLRHFDSICE